MGEIFSKSRQGQDKSPQADSNANVATDTQALQKIIIWELTRARINKLISLGPKFWSYLVHQVAKVEYWAQKTVFATLQAEILFKIEQCSVVDSWFVEKLHTHA